MRTCQRRCLRYYYYLPKKRKNNIIYYITIGEISSVHIIIIIIISSSCLWRVYIDRVRSLWKKIVDGCTIIRRVYNTSLQRDRIVWWPRSSCVSDGIRGGRDQWTTTTAAVESLGDPSSCV